MNVQGKEQQTEKAATPDSLFLVNACLDCSFPEWNQWDLGHCSKEKVRIDSETEEDQEHLAKYLLKSGIDTSSREKLEKDQ